MSFLCTLCACACVCTPHDTPDSHDMVDVTREALALIGARVYMHQLLHSAEENDTSGITDAATALNDLFDDMNSGVPCDHTLLDVV